MFGIGTQEILIILVLAIIVIGPKRLPELATTLGKGLAEFKKAFDGLKDGMTADFRTELEKEELLKKYPQLAEQEAAREAAAEQAGEEAAAAAGEAAPQTSEPPRGAGAANPPADAAPGAASPAADAAQPGAEAAPAGPPDLSKLEASYKPEEMES